MSLVYEKINLDSFPVAALVSAEERGGNHREHCILMRSQGSRASLRDMECNLSARLSVSRELTRFSASENPRQKFTRGIFFSNMLP